MQSFGEENYTSSDRNSKISNPKVSTFIRAASSFLKSTIRMTDSSDMRFSSENFLLYVFSDEKYISEKPEAFDEKLITVMRKVPSVDNIVIFMETLFECAHFSPECCFI